MSYLVKILKDSKGPNGVRLITWELTFPRFVLAEFNTHRLFSRNAASSRAIPIAKQIKAVLKDPVIPKFWGKNKPGMQADEELTGWHLWFIKQLWLKGRYLVVLLAWLCYKLGLHKQLANRLLEPYLFITVIMTSTELANWFRLRDHKAAQPEIAWVAHEMNIQQAASVPEELSEGTWHLPLVDDDQDWDALDKLYPDAWGAERQHLMCKVSAGRCARVSYLTHDGKRDLNEDIKLADRLMASGHWSPFEHVARARCLSLLRDEYDRAGNRFTLEKNSADVWSGNLRGWLQFRETVDTNFTVVSR
jgi:hypothetical protein